MTSDYILETVKAFIGLDKDYDPFDSQILVIINSAFMYLFQLGVLNVEGCIITKESKWDEFDFTAESASLIRHYICLKTRQQFDPVASSTIKDVYQQEIAELEWRINAAVDPGVNEVRDY